MSGFVLNSVIKKILELPKTLDQPATGRWCVIVRDELVNELSNAFYNQESPVIEGVKCPECGSEMISRKGQYGTFWGCKQYPRCKGTRDSQGRSKAEREAEKDKKRSEREWTVE